MKRFLSFLISLVTLASCTGMLDDMQSQIDDLDSRVTALEKDSKLISENLSTVKKDLEVGLEAISALCKSTNEIADTLAARKARLQNDMEASMKLIQMALSNIDELKSTDTKLAQSIVDAYAAINVAMNLANKNSSEITKLSNSLSALSSSISNLKENCTASRKSYFSDLTLTYVEYDSYGYVLLQRLTDSIGITEIIYTPGSSHYIRNSRNSNSVLSQEYCNTYNTLTEKIYSYTLDNNVVREFYEYKYVYTRDECNVACALYKYIDPVTATPEVSGYYSFEGDSGHYRIAFGRRCASALQFNFKLWSHSSTLIVDKTVVLSCEQMDAISGIFLKIFETFVLTKESALESNVLWNSFVDSADFIDSTYKFPEK